MAVATAADVSARIGRPLTANETIQVNALLEDTEAEIVRLGFKKIADPAWKPLIVKVECAVVRRAARLPDAVQNVIPGDENTGFADQVRVQGAIYLRREERRSLGLPLVGSGRITPSVPNETRTLDEWLENTGWGDGSCVDSDWVFDNSWPY